MAARDLPVLLLLVVGLLAIWAEMPSAAEAKGICSLPPYPGPCLALIRRWYFDWKTRRCEEFDYGGCRGNANNFKTRRECQLTCGGRLPRPSGECPRIQGTGICVELCSSDKNCKAGEKCCSNGCGHTCVKVH